jgi:hypothetical protein
LITPFVLNGNSKRKGGDLEKKKKKKKGKERKKERKKVKFSGI